MPNTALCEYRRNRTILVFFTHPGFLHIHLECPERDFLSGGHPRPERDVTYHVPRWSPQPAYLVEEYIVEHSPRYHLFRVSTGSLSDANIFCFILDRAFLSSFWDGACCRIVEHHIICRCNLGATLWCGFEQKHTFAFLTGSIAVFLQRISRELLHQDVPQHFGVQLLWSASISKGVVIAAVKCIYAFYLTHGPWILLVHDLTTFNASSGRVLRSRLQLVYCSSQIKLVVEGFFRHPSWWWTDNDDVMYRQAPTVFFSLLILCDYEWAVRGSIASPALVHGDSCYVVTCRLVLVVQ
jgi:hypothetical protein